MISQILCKDIKFPRWHFFRNSSSMLGGVIVKTQCLTGSPLTTRGSMRIVACCMTYVASALNCADLLVRDSRRCRCRPVRSRLP